MILRRILLALCLALAVSMFGILPANAIVDGTQVTPPNPYTWNTLLHFTNTPSDQSGDNICGATLIGARFVITSAHCVNGKDPANMYVTVGGYDRDLGQTSGQTIHVSSYIQNPLFNNATLTNDLALLILDQDATGVKTPIYVTQTEIGAGRTATIIGWGSTSEGGPSVSELRQAQVKTIDRATCEANLSGHGFSFDASTICAGIIGGGADTCTEDSGGPIFIVGPDGKPVQIGITSWGVGCGRPNLPGAYSNLANMLGFILDTLGGQAAVNLVDYAVTGNQLKVAQIFDQIGAAAADGSSLRQDYGRLFMNGVAGTATSLQSLLPTSAFEMIAMVQTFVSMESSNIMPRIRSLREGTTGGMLDISGMRLTSAGTAGSVDRTTGLSNFGTSSTVNGSYDLTSATGYSADTSANSGVSQNADKMYSPNLYADTSRAQPQRLVQEAPVVIGGQQPQRLTDTTSQNNIVVSGMAAPSDYASSVSGYDASGNPVINQPQVLAQPQQAVTTQPQNYAPQRLIVSNQQPAYAAQNPAWRQQPAPKREGGVMEWVSGLFGGHDVEVSDRPNLPRTATYTSQDLAYERASRYPGQPLGMYARNLSSGYQTSSYMPAAQASTIGQPDSVRVDLPSQYAMVSTSAPVNLSDSELDDTTLYQPTTASVTTFDPVSNSPLSRNSYEVDPADRIGTVAIPLRKPATINADRRWGVFMSGDVRFGDEQLLKQGGDTAVDNTGFTLGVDYRVVDKSFIGMALSYAHGSFTTGDFSDVQGDGYAVSLYGTTSFLKSAYLDGFISFGYHTFDSERTLWIGNGQHRTATAEPDAYHFSGKAEAGYDFTQNAWKFGPFAGMKLSYANFGSYTENGGGNFNLHVYDREDFSAIGSLGMGASRRFAMSNGGVVAPSMRVAYNHEFGDKRADIKSHFISAPTMPFITEGAQRELDWLSINPSVSAALVNNWIFQADYEHDFMRYNVDTHIFNLAARYKW